MGPELGYNALGGVSSTLWLLLWLYTLGFTGAMSFTMGILARSSESCLFSYVIISVLSFTIIIPSTTLAYLLCPTRVSLQIPPKPTQYPLRRQRKPGFRIGKRSVRTRENFPPSSPHTIQSQQTPQSTRSIIHPNSTSPSSSILHTTMHGSTSSGVEIPPSFKFYGPTMPRPGQPGQYWQ